MALASWLTRACKPYAALEPRFWTVPPAYHIQELCLCLLVAVTAAALSSSCSHSRSTPPRLPTGRTTLETGLGALLLLWLPVNVCNKLAVQGMPPSRALVEMCLPCHVYTGLCAFCFLSTRRRARVDGYSLMLHCAWMPLLAVAFPDLSAARAIAAPALRMGSLATFWAHHLTLLAAPVLARQQASSRLRFAPPPPPPRAAGLLQYLAFIYDSWACSSAASPSPPAGTLTTPCGRPRPCPTAPTCIWVARDTGWRSARSSLSCSVRSCGTSLCRLRPPARCGRWDATTP
jgi:hypothetical protein